MKYLKKFENHAAYEAAESGLILPNVSLCVSENEVHYNPSQPTPPTPSHDYVEIGGIKWATMNIGANSVTDAGLYFQWGDTQGYTADQVGSGSGQKYFGWEDYKWTEDGGETLTKYNYEDGLETLEPSDDAATAAWGGNWRMPTIWEFSKLRAATTSAWTANYEGSGVAGIVITSNADSSKKLFFPAADNAFEGSISDADNGFYWSSSVEYDFGVSYSVDFGDNYLNWMASYARCFGFLVRGVLDE